MIHFSLYDKLPKEQHVLNLSFKLGFREVLFGHQSQPIPTLSACTWEAAVLEAEWLISLTERGFS